MASRFLAGAAHANRSGGQLMSQFIVVGASVEVAEDSLVVDPSLLFVYPPDKPLLDVSLPLFCFPDGVRLKKLRRTTSSSRINEVRYSNLSLLESVRSSFTFLLTGHEEVLYGVCVHSEELLDELPCFVSSVSSAADEIRPRLRASSVRASLAMKSGAASPALCAPRCYCLVSRFPFFKLHFDFLYSLIAKDRHLRMVAGSGASELLPLLKAYAEQAIPEDKKTLSFKLPGDLHEFAFVLPGTDQDSLLEAFCGARVLEVGAEALVQLVACLLSETKIVVVGEQLGAVSTFVLGLIPLLKPLVWQGSLVPLLPVAMHEALEAPVPFVFGVRGELPQYSKEVAVLDLDRRQFVALPSEVPAMPRADDLRRALKARAGLGAVSSHIRELLRRADEMAPADWSAREAAQEASEKGPRSERPFWARLFETQLFHGHLGARLDESEARQRAQEEQIAKRAASAGAARFDALIAAERAAVKELEALLEDHTRKLIMSKERLEALQLARFAMLH